ncbi:MAG TPA: 16S rRNA (cytosine(1402)-N(4))-methyltransferase RsmH, partial [Anaerolineae bacterium]|nr:16S rRNA (cytosine(1402)-N(4))-methyltransferase RsmH [Anaerolineae bacterium]
MSRPLLHTPVLLDEVLEGLEIRAGGRYIDCTVGTGGHARAILERSDPGGELLGIDLDLAAIVVAERQLSSFGKRVTLVHDSFAQLRAIASAEGFIPADGVLLDLGLSSLQLESAERGFSFQRDGPLDMRMDRDGDITAAHLVNELDGAELAEIIAKYGEEIKARAIARAIVRNRPLGTTLELANVVARAVGRSRRLHPATRTFQALRIAVNEELEALSTVLPPIPAILAKGGRVAIISFHSLEDRLVKDFMVRESRDCLCPPEIVVCTCGHKRTLQILTKKPVRPSANEVAQNPRSRSA